MNRQLHRLLVHELRLHPSRTFHSFQHGHQLFDKMARPKLSLAKSMLDSLHQRTHFEALSVFKERLQNGFYADIDEITIAIALKACKGHAELGRQIHAFATTSGFISCLSVSNSLMSMYRKSGNFDLALCIFQNLENPDSVSCNTVLSGFDNAEDALGFACRMNYSGIVFDAWSYSTILAHCADHEEFLFGIQLQSLILKCGLGCELYIGNALITMYSKWRRVVDAARVFDEMPDKDLVSWNAMLSGYSQGGHYGSEAIWAFIEMFTEGMKLDHVSFISVASACGEEKNLDLGRQIHGMTLKKGSLRHVPVSNVLISMYIKCDAFHDAVLVFEGMSDRNVVTWTTMLSEDKENAVCLFKEMRREGVYPNEVTFVGLVHAVTVTNLVEQGRTLHGSCIKSSFLTDSNVANCFITMYAKYDSLEDSEKIFEELKYKGTVSWSSLISGYAQNSRGQEALETFLSAIHYSRPNQHMFGSVLSAIGATEAISVKHGQRCHSYLLKLGLNTDPIVSSALLDMYAKRGSISESRIIFDEMSERSQVAWTAIISAHSRHGEYESVMSLFDEMNAAGTKPDSITFLSILTACGRKGMVDTGQRIFNSMVKDHLIEPSAEHYACMVDMLGRVGRLKEAEELASQVPRGPGFSLLQSLLGACRVHGNMEMGRRTADALLQMEPQESGSYVLISNLYAEKGDWEKVARIRKAMRDKRVIKEIGFSWVDVGGDASGSSHLHGFSSDDKSHPLTEEIYRMVEHIGSTMKLLNIERQRSSEDTVCVV